MGLLYQRPTTQGERDARKKTSVTDLRDCEQAVMAAAREERAALAGLQEGIKPGDPDWTESNEETYQARLGRWRTASRALVEALNRVDKRPNNHATEKPDGRALATN
jgi:uncharacterized protein YukE